MGGANRIITTPFQVDHNTPNLYTLRTQLLSEDKVLDETTRKIGIRTIRYTAWPAESTSCEKTDNV